MTSKTNNRIGGATARPEVFDFRMFAALVSLTKIHKLAIKPSLRQAL